MSTKKNPAQIEEINSYTGGLAGKRILDVGSSFAGQLIQDIAEKYDIKEAIGMALNANKTELAPNVHVEHGDIRNAKYEDNSFDVIVSTSAFEHIYDFPRALSEMHRILKPGGVLWSKFSPIWSCSFGHHVWVRHDGEFKTYWNVILPPFCHLLMTAQELLDYCMPKYGAVLSQKIVEFIYVSPNVNRLFYEDFERAFAASRFRQLLFSAYQNPKAELIYGPLLEPDTYDRLQERFPSYHNFYAHGIVLVGRKTGE